MNFRLYSYRFAGPILDHPAYVSIRDEIFDIVRATPLPVFPGKSSNNPKLDVLQQVLNSYYDYEFVVARDWEYHPSATAIPGSGLAADFKKELDPGGGYEPLTVQVEAQFGNMSRWYSDVFKFATSYSQGQVNLGVSIVPVQHLSVRIDSNVANYERVLRELPHAKMSITLPILVVGLDPDASTSVYDLSTTKIGRIGRGAAGAFVGRGTIGNRLRALYAIRNGLELDAVTEAASRQVV
jgi:hypothetical protein